MRQYSSRLEGHSLLDACSLFGKGTTDTDGGLTTERIPTQTLANTFFTGMVVKEPAGKSQNACLYQSLSEYFSGVFFFYIAKNCLGCFWCQSVVLHQSLCF